MGLVKVIKNRAYFKRYQVKYRRRREGKTDYRARKALILQDKNKYNVRKIRFIVRRTNNQIICQFATAHIEGDKILAEAKSKELVRYGIPVGLKNYAAAYATGLLCARRFLKSLNLDGVFVGAEKASGEHFDIQGSDRRPVKAFLDVGITITTTGNKVFGAVKGATDGGVYIPHGDKRFPASKTEFNPEQLRKNIFGIHVAEYMKALKEEDTEKYESHFHDYIKNKIEPDDIEQMYLKAHEKIRANPERPEKKTSKKFVSKTVKPKKLNAQQRRERVQEKLAKYVETLQ